MDMTHTYWEENSNTQSVKYEGCHTIENPGAIKDDRAIYTCCDSNLNFSTATCSEDDCEYGPYKKSKVSRQDPLSHRIIEKRRRDRMNNCLADLSRLIPTDYLKKGRGRIEKTEIIEMAIKHMKFLQSSDRVSPIEHYKLGYRECISEVMRFMVEVEGHFSREPICVRLLNHLQKHCDQVSKNYDSSSTYSDYNHIPAYSAKVPTLLKSKMFNNNNNVQSKLRELDVPKDEPANSNSNDSHSNASTSEPQKADDFEKEMGTTGMSYKYKTSIKLRFNQDVSAHEVPKRQKLNNESKNVASFENQSLNQSVPPSNEPYTRISDNENMHSPPNSIARKNGHVLEENMQELPSLSKVYSSDDNNFNIPIFVLHAKGSYYVPLTIDYKTLLPFLHNYNILDIAPAMTNLVLHPVTINVNFLPSYNEKQNKQYRYKCYNSH